MGGWCGIAFDYFSNLNKEQPGARSRLLSNREHKAHDWNEVFKQGASFVS
jgi:hypothetical protein